MIFKKPTQPEPYRAYGRKHLEKIEPLNRLDSDILLDIKTASTVLPFHVNNYVIDNLIDWNNIPNDPIFQLTFPQRGMLDSWDFKLLRNLVANDAPQSVIKRMAQEIQSRMNPHPAGQMDLNVPAELSESSRGLQHKYRETVLFFPSQGQTCHAYCTYCFRWAQFSGLQSMRFASSEVDTLVNYIECHPDVTDVLLTGGDPMIMKTSILRRYIEPLLKIEHLHTIRIGTKATSYWPQRFVTDKDADDLMRLFEEVVASGKHIALMAHYSHACELQTPIAKQAVQRIRSTGAVVRGQAPLIRHINDSALDWQNLWHEQVRLGIVPYYMFVERDTGPRNYFEVPLARAFDIFSTAYRHVSGLGRTVRGPSMSATPGKVLVDGIMEIGDEKVFMLKFLQARNPEWVNRVFAARFDPYACWLDDLVPAFGEEKFFFEDDLQEMLAKPDNNSEEDLRHELDY
jgi:KamA family protein